MVFYQQSSSLCYILEQRTVYFNSFPATISASTQKCSTKMFHIYGPMTFSPPSPKFRRLHMTPISGCSVAAGRHRKDRKFWVGVSIGSEEFLIVKFLDAYSSSTNISPLNFGLPTSSTAPNNIAPRGWQAAFSPLYCCVQITAGSFRVCRGQVLCHPTWKWADSSLQFPSLRQSSRTCTRSTLSLVERGCHDPQFFPLGLQFSIW